MATRKEASGSMRAAERTLEVLRALNETNPARVSDLHAATRISRPSLYRVLETLCVLGYVRKRGDERYELTARIRQLASGFREDAWICETALPVMQGLQREIVWPTDLAMLDGEAMLLAETTRQASPLTIDAFRAGARLPLLRTAAGRAYLAWCPAAERRAVLDTLEREPDSLGLGARDRRAITQVLAQTRRNGYGQQFGELDGKIGAIAVPVMLGERVVATLGITFISSALTCAEAARRYLTPLRGAAEEIEQLLAATPHGDAPRTAARIRGSAG